MPTSPRASNSFPRTACEFGGIRCSPPSELFASGPSAGGARPKASVHDEHGVLWLAKFPSRTDPFDVTRMEWATLKLAAHGGLTVPAVRLVEFGDKPVMLSQRFDRYRAGSRECRRPRSRTPRVALESAERKAATPLSTTPSPRAQPSRWNAQRQFAVIAQVVRGVADWRNFFEALGLEDRLLEQIDSAFRDIAQVASSKLLRELAAVELQPRTDRAAAAPTISP